MVYYEPSIAMIPFLLVDEHSPQELVRKLKKFRHTPVLVSAECTGPRAVPEEHEARLLREVSSYSPDTLCLLPSARLYILEPTPQLIPYNLKLDESKAEVVVVDALTTKQVEETSKTCTLEVLEVDEPLTRAIILPDRDEALIPLTPRQVVHITPNPATGRAAVQIHIPAKTYVKTEDRNGATLVETSTTVRDTLAAAIRKEEVHEPRMSCIDLLA